MCTYNNTYLCPLSLVGWQGSQVMEHVWCLAQSVPVGSLNLKVAQVGQTFCKKIYQCFAESPTWMNSTALIKVREHIYLLCACIFAAF